MTEDRYTTSHAASDALAGHRHTQAYLALVEAGAYEEYSADGVYRCQAGVAVIHPPWHWHGNTFAGRDVRVTNVKLPGTQRYGVFALSERHFAYARTLLTASELIGFVSEAGQSVSARWGGFRVQEMAEMLRDDPGQRIDEVARSLRMSPEHAARQFRRHVGMTPAAYRSEHRFRRAMRLLCRGTDAIDVAVQCGYSDQSHLCRIVKAATSRTITDLQRSDFFNTDTIDCR